MKIFQNLHPDSKVWIYGANSLFTSAQVELINARISKFTESWTSHQMQVKAGAAVLYNAIIVFAADETVTGVSGCGIDKSVHLVKELEQETGLQFFNRMLLYLKQGDSIEVLTKSEIEARVNQGIVSRQSLVFNTLTSNLHDLTTSTWVPLEKTWVWPKIKQLV